MMTLEFGLIRTWRFPRFSALTMLFRQSRSTLIRTIFTTGVTTTVAGWLGTWTAAGAHHIKDSYSTSYVLYYTGHNPCITYHKYVHMQCPYTRCHFNRAEKQLNATDPPTGSSRHAAVFVHAIHVAHWWNRISHVHKRLQIGRKKSKAQSWGSNGSFNCCSHFKHVITGHLPKSSPTGHNKTAQLLLQPFDRQLRHTGEPCLTRMKDGELMVKRLHWEPSKKHKRVLCSIVKCQHPCRIQKFSMC